VIKKDDTSDFNFSILVPDILMIVFLLRKPRTIRKMMPNIIVIELA
jgi:hypothetical protein